MHQNYQIASSLGVRYTTAHFRDWAFNLCMSLYFWLLSLDTAKKKKKAYNKIFHL